MSPVHVLLIESSPCFTNRTLLSPVHVLLISPVHVLLISPVHVLLVQSSPCFTICPLYSTCLRISAPVSGSLSRKYTDQSLGQDRINCSLRNQSHMPSYDLSALDSSTHLVRYRCRRVMNCFGLSPSSGFASRNRTLNPFSVSSYLFHRASLSWG